MKTWAIIPARGGSTRIPHKNTRKVDGLTLVEHAIEAARACDHIVVSTDDAEISAICDRRGVDVVSRPDIFATSSAALEPVIAHALVEMSIDDDDVIALLQPTSPRRTRRHVEEAVRMLTHDATGQPLENVHGSVVAVCRDVKPVAFGGSVDAAGVFVRTHQRRINTQDMAGMYGYENGAIYVTTVREFLRSNSRMPDPVRAYWMTPRESVDIDTMDDLGLTRVQALAGMDE
jgi:CMP-N-acetylneuraminic acid synthetase